MMEPGGAVSKLGQRYIFRLKEAGASYKSIEEDLGVPLRQVKWNLMLARPSGVDRIKLPEVIRTKKDKTAIVRAFQRSPNKTWAEIKRDAKVDLKDHTIREFLNEEGLWHLRKTKTNPTKKSALGGRGSRTKRTAGGSRDSGWEWVRRDPRKRVPSRKK